MTLVKLAILLLQLWPFPGPGVRSISSAPAFVQAASTDSGSAQILSTPLKSTTTGNTLFAFWGGQLACSGYTSMTSSPSDTAGDSFVPIVPTSTGAYILGAKVTAGGTGYNADPACSISGGSGAATCTATRSGTSVNAIIMGSTTVPFTGAATITIVPVSGGSGATAEVVAYGIGNSSTECTTAWYAKNITGNANNSITVDAQSTLTFIGLTSIEVSGVSTTSPFGVAASGVTSGTSVTSGTFGSTSNGIVVCGARVEALSQTWTAGTGFTIPSGATTTQTFMTAQYKANYDPTGTTTSISSGGSADRELICANFK